MTYIENKNVQALMKAINQSDPVKREVAYYGIGYCLAIKLINKDNTDVSLARIRLVNILDVVNEMAIINYDRLKEVCINAILIRSSYINGEMPVLATNGSIGNLFFYQDYLSADQIDNINKNFDILKNVLMSCDVWYNNTYLKGE